MVRALIKTYGCRVNQADSQKILELLYSRGIRLSEDPSQEPQIIVLNSCVVTENAEREVFKELRIVKKRFPQSMIIITGCLPKLLKEKEFMEGVSIAEDLNSLKELLQKAGFAETSLHHPLPQLRTRFMLKVQEGCDRFCSFCIVPLVRGKPRSKPVDEAVREAKVLEERGAREIVITGTHLGDYGKDIGLNEGLKVLLQSLLRETNVKRFRLSSLDPDELSDSLIELISKEERICKHFHLPLQSGSEKILNLMRRKCSPREFLEKVKTLHSLMPEANVGTDIIVGFPFEEDEDFERTKELIFESGVNYLHIFPFSRRPKTPAGTLPPLPQEVVKRRCAQLREIDKVIRRSFHSIFEGKIMEVLIEEVEDGFIRGTTSNYLKVEIEGQTNARKNEIIPVKIGKSHTSYLQGFIA